MSENLFPTYEFKPFSEIRGDHSAEHDWASAGMIEAIEDPDLIEANVGKTALQLHQWWAGRRQGNDIPVKLEVEYLYKTDSTGEAANFNQAQLRLKPTAYHEDKLGFDQFKALKREFTEYKQTADSVRVRPR